MQDRRWTCLREARYPSKRVNHRDVGANEPERHHLLLEHGSAKLSLEDFFVPVAEGFVSRKEHALHISECPFCREVPGISICITPVPRGHFLFQNLSNGRFIWLGLGVHKSCKQ